MSASRARYPPDNKPNSSVRTSVRVIMQNGKSQQVEARFFRKAGLPSLAEGKQEDCVFRKNGRLGRRIPRVKVFDELPGRDRSASGSKLR
jgi:hypothetical protein